MSRRPNSSLLFYFLSYFSLFLCSTCLYFSLTVISKFVQNVRHRRDKDFDRYGIFAEPCVSLLTLLCNSTTHFTPSLRVSAFSLGTKFILGLPTEPKCKGLISGSVQLKYACNRYRYWNLQNLHWVPYLILAVAMSIPDHPFTRG